LLTRVESLTNDITRSIYHFDRHFAEGLVPYHWLAAYACEAIDGQRFINGRPGMAVNRAVKRLARASKVRAYWKRAGVFGWVGLPKCCDVTQKDNNGTLREGEAA
jgi:hypothetical protein